MYVKNKGQTRTGSVYYGSSRSTPMHSQPMPKETVTAVNPNPIGTEPASVMPPPNYHGTVFSESREAEQEAARVSVDDRAVPVQETPAPAPTCGENARANIPQSPAQPIPDIRQSGRPDVPRRIRLNTPTRQSPIGFARAVPPAADGGGNDGARSEKPSVPERPVIPETPDGGCTCVPPSSCTSEHGCPRPNGSGRDCGCRVPAEKGSLSDISQLLRRMGGKLSSDELLLWGMIILLLGQGGDEWIILALLWLLFA